MMLENWSFRRDNLAVLNIIRKGLLGDVSYAQCAYAHDCNDIWFFDDKGEFRWPGRYLTKRNADQYPTHGLGPVMSWMDINCGDYPAYLTSTASRAISVNHHFTKKFGPDHPMAKQKFKQGDFVVTVIRTMQGKTIVVYNDMVSPRPYDNRWEISGTNGIYSQAHNGIYIEGMRPVNHGEHGWENFDTYQDKFDHAWHKEIRSVVGGLKTGVMAHGAPDYLVVKKFVDAAAAKGPMPITIYDSVLMSAPVPLSEESIAKGSARWPFPISRGASGKRISRILRSRAESSASGRPFCRGGFHSSIPREPSSRKRRTCLCRAVQQTKNGTWLLARLCPEA